MYIYIYTYTYSIVEEQLIDDAYLYYSEFRANALVRQSIEVENRNQILLLIK